MKKYKIKFKLGHLIIAVLVIFFALPTLIYMVGDTLISMGVKSYSANKRYYGAATMELYTKLPKIIPSGGETYYKIGTSYYDVIKDKVYIGTGGMTNNDIGNEERAKRAIEIFKEGLSLGEKDKAYKKNLSMLINSYVALGDVDNAYKYIEQAILSSNIDVREVGFINKAILKAKNKEFDEALAICKSNMSNKEFGNLYLEILYNYGDMNLYNEEIYKVSYLTENNDIELLKQVDFTYRLNYRRRSFGDKNLKGRVVKDGEGVPYQKISLQSGQRYFGDYYPKQLEDSKAVYTDKDGYYEFKEITSGEHQCTVSLQGYLLDNSYMFQNGMWENGMSTWPVQGFNAKNDEKIVEKNFTIKKYLDIENKEEILKESNDYLTIKLPKVEGATQVEIDLSAWGSFPLFSNIKENFEVRIPLSNKTFIIKNLSNDNIANAEFLGTVEDIEMHLGIIYRNERGEILEKTKPFEELKFIAKGKVLNEGDKLITEDKFEDAIKWYNERMEEEGDKREYLYPILRYYQYWNHTKLDEEESKKNFEKYLNRLEALGIEDVEVNYFEWRGSEFYDKFAGY